MGKSDPFPHKEGKRAGSYVSMDTRRRMIGGHLKGCSPHWGMMPCGLGHLLIFQSSRLCPLARAGDSLSQNHQLPEGGQAVDPSSAPDLDEARSDRDPRWKSPATPAGPTCGCLQELNPTTGSSFGDLGGSEFKDLAQREERRQAAPTTQRPSTSLWGRKLAQGAPRPSGLPSQGLSEPHDPPEGLSWSLGQERAELQKLLRLGIPQRQREEAPQEQKERPGVQRGEVRRGESKEVPKRPTEKIQQGQRGEATQALREEVSVDPRGQAPEGERRESPQRQRGNSPEGQRKEVLREPRKETPQGREGKSPQTSPGCLSQAWEVPQGEAPTQPPAEGGSLGISGDFCRPLGEQMPQPGGRESPGSGERTTQLPQDETEGQSRASAPAAGEQRAARQGARPPLPRPRLPAGPPLPGPGAEPLAAPGTGRSGQREQPAALPGRPGLVREPHGLQDPEGSPGPAEQVPCGSARLPGTVGGRRGGAEAPEAPKAAWPGLPGGEQASAGVSAAQQETALQRLLELHRAARRRRRQDREQQRLRVLERLRLARNRHCRVHPLGPPPGPAQLPPQASLPGEGGGAAAILPGRGRGTSRVPYEREPRAAARTPKEGGGARLPGCCPLPAPSGPRGGRPGPQRCARPRRTRRGGGAPCGSSCSEGSGRGPGGCGPSGPGTPRTSSSYCGPPALRSLRLERRAHPSRPPPVLAESSKARLQRRGLRKSKLATRRPASAEQR
ncbi:collagen alpha-1(I) chain-like [Ursus americanus]|uniref:collagen alpha-1(I) chain-like n=1 Tax=Ursus americanus TaxID=9643 RepID=UPI001E67D6EB|nr:collagen alpha-1(I) chain-like [Ursus americanus]